MRPSILLLLVLPACSLPGADAGRTSFADAQRQARGVAQDLAEVGPPGPVSVVTWARACDSLPDSSDREPAGRYVTVVATATKPIPEAAVPDLRTAEAFADDVAARARELDLRVGGPRGRLIAAVDRQHALSLFGGRLTDPVNADVKIPIFDDLGAQEAPLWTAEVVVRCAEGDPRAEPLPGQTAELVVAQAQRELQRAEAALGPLRASFVPERPQECAPPKRSTSIGRRVELQPAASLQQVQRLLDEVWPTADAWTHNSDPSVLRQSVQYRRRELTATYEHTAPGRGRLTVGGTCFR